MLRAGVDMRVVRLGAGLCASLMASACAPLVVQQGARTVRPGSVQAGMSLEAESQTAKDGEYEYQALEIGMTPNGWVRLGLTESLDAGLQFYGSGVRADGKFAPVQTEAIAVAVGVGLGGGYSQTRDTTDESFGSSSTVTSHFWADVGAFFTTAIRPGIDANLALKYLQGELYSRDEYDESTDRSSTQQTGFGGALGLAIRRDQWTISPEIAVWQVQTRDTEAVDDDPPPTLIIVPSVGFSVGF